MLHDFYLSVCSLGLVPLMHMAEIAQLLPRFAELDQAINSGARQWSPAQAAEAQQLLEAAEAMLERTVLLAGAPEMVQGLLLLEAAVVDENTR